jgi:hypothetical protein
MDDGPPSPKPRRRKRYRSREADLAEEFELGPQEARRLAILRLAKRLRASNVALGRSALCSEPEEPAPRGGDTVPGRCRCGYTASTPILGYSIFHVAAKERPPCLVHQVSTEEHLEKVLSACPRCGANRHPTYLISAADEGPATAPTMSRSAKQDVGHKAQQPTSTLVFNHRRSHITTVGSSHWLNVWPGALKQAVWAQAGAGHSITQPALRANAAVIV